MYTEAILIRQNLIKFQPAVGCIRRRVIKLEFPPKCCYYTFERIFIGSSLGGLMPRSL